VGDPQAARASTGPPFEAAGHLLTAGAAGTLDDAAHLRRQRHDTRYRQERADSAAADEAAPVTARRTADVPPALRAVLR